MSFKEIGQLPVPLRMVTYQDMESVLREESNETVLRHARESFEQGAIAVIVEPNGKVFGAMSSQQILSCHMVWGRSMMKFRATAPNNLPTRYYDET